MGLDKALFCLDHMALIGGEVLVWRLAGQAATALEEVNQLLEQKISIPEGRIVRSTSQRELAERAGSMAEIECAIDAMGNNAVRDADIDRLTYLLHATIQQGTFAQIVTPLTALCCVDWGGGQGTGVQVYAAVEEGLEAIGAICNPDDYAEEAELVKDIALFLFKSLGASPNLLSGGAMNLLVGHFRSESRDTKYTHYVRDAMAVSLAMLPPEKIMVKVQRLAKDSIKGRRLSDPDSPKNCPTGSQSINAAGFSDGEGVSAADELVRALRPIEQTEALAEEANSLCCVLKALCKFGGSTMAVPLSEQSVKFSKQTLKQAESEGPALPKLQMLIAMMVLNDGISLLRGVLEYIAKIDASLAVRWRTHKKVAELLGLLIHSEPEYMCSSTYPVQKNFQMQIQQAVRDEEFMRLLSKTPDTKCVDDSKQSADIRRYVATINRILKDLSIPLSLRTVSNFASTTLGRASLAG